MSEKYDEVLVEMKQQSAEIAALQKRVEKVEATNSGQEVQELRQELNSLEQYTRRQNLEIHGLKHDINEDLLGKLNALANELKLPRLSEHELDGLHRLPEKKGKSPAVLVRFVSRTTRDQWMAKRRVLSDTNSGVHMLDNLTAYNKKLLWAMKRKAAEMAYQYAWQSNGKLFVRKAQGDTAIRIEGHADLDKIR
ncbi:uncharacterized protein LOC144109688 [Amblyomma americanum]